MSTKVIEKKTGLKRKQPGHWKYLCPRCLKTWKENGTCGVPGHERIMVSHKIHFPKVTASKKQWLKVYNLFKNPYYKDKPEWKVFYETILKK